MAPLVLRSILLLERYKQLVQFYWCFLYLSVLPQVSLQMYDDLNTLLQQFVCKWLLSDSEISNSGTLHFHSISAAHQLTYSVECPSGAGCSSKVPLCQCDNDSVLVISCASPWHTKTREHRYQQKEGTSELWTRKNYSCSHCHIRSAAKWFTIQSLAYCYRYSLDSIHRLNI